jgi:hypothetical protein
MMNVTQQDIGLWEVWIEFDQSHPEYFGTLYVHGEIALDKKIHLALSRMDSKNEGTLNLRLPACTTSFQYTKEVLYSEPIRNPNQYTSVRIYSGEELIGCFNEIEIMI